MTCNKTGTMPLAWQFTNGSTPVDSVSTLPRLKFYASCPAPSGPNGYPSGAILASSAPNAADLTSGSSGWQYFANDGHEPAAVLVAVQLRLDRPAPGDVLLDVRRGPGVPDR